jgi:hypothetical protein
MKKNKTDPNIYNLRNNHENREPVATWRTKFILSKNKHLTIVYVFFNKFLISLF